jgi:hypothetical protein
MESHGNTLGALLRRSSLHGAMAAIDGDSWQGPDYMGTAAHVPFSPWHKEWQRWNVDES